jgi:predicted enzyme related to lactoylglutathione lyase
MLSRAHIVPNIAVKDLEKARRFYGDVLGLKETAGDAEWIQFGSEDGTKLCIYKKERTTPADSTRAVFEVADLDAEVRALRERGATFEEVDLEGAKRDGVITSFTDDERMAWLKDPEGNWLGLMEEREAKTRSVSHTEHISV